MLQQCLTFLVTEDCYLFHKILFKDALSQLNFKKVSFFLKHGKPLKQADFSPQHIISKLTWPNFIKLFSRTYCLTNYLC